jgi:hypothetical protein
MESIFGQPARDKAPPMLLPAGLRAPAAIVDLVPAYPRAPQLVGHSRVSCRSSALHPHGLGTRPRRVHANPHQVLPQPRRMRCPRL